jgi:diguanylate cyclase (GGDEF)-like protein
MKLTPDLSTPSKSLALPKGRLVRALSIRTRVALLVVACVLPAWLAAGYFTFETYLQNRARLENLSQTAAKRLMLVVERELAGISSGLQALGTSPSIDHRDLAAFDAQARQVRTQLGGLNILLIDRDGQQLINTARAFGQTLPKEPHSALMLNVLQTKRPSITNLFYGPVLKKYLVAMVVPVLRNNAVDAFLSMSMDAANLSEVLDIASIPAGWHVSVYDANGKLIADTVQHDLSLEHNAPGVLIDALKAGREGGLRMSRGNGANVWMTYQTSSNYGWTATVAVSDDMLTAELWKTLWLQLTGAVGLLLAGLLLATWIGRGIADPIQALVAPALALGRGEPLSIPELNLTEAIAVGNALQATQSLLLQREHERDQARTDSLTDGLTGLSNRRRFDAAIDLEFARMRRCGESLSLIMLDIDHFKHFNDALGHPAGDACLRQVGDLISTIVSRTTDLAARYGGEEFGIILPNTDLSGATELAQRIEDGINGLIIMHPASSVAPHVTVSQGVITVDSTAAQSALDVVKLADALLYQAKLQGRNQIVARNASISPGES